MVELRRGVAALLLAWAVLAGPGTASAAPGPLDPGGPVAVDVGPDGVAVLSGAASTDAAGFERFTERPVLGDCLGGICPQPSGVDDDALWGPDDRLWFTGHVDGDEGAVDVLYRSPSASSPPGTPPTAIILGAPANSRQGYGLAVGPDGHVWFHGAAGLGHVAPGSTTPTIVHPGFGQRGAVTPGPDGNLWFTARTVPGVVGHVAPDGSGLTIIETGLDRPRGITQGPDGNLWVVSFGDDAIARITPAGAVTTFAGGPEVDGPKEIVAGPDGNLWFTSSLNDRVGRITPTGAITTYADPDDRVDDPHDIVVGPGGLVYFTSSANSRMGVVVGERLATIATPYVAGGHANAVTASTDSIWYLAGSDRMRLYSAAAPVTPPAGVAVSRAGGSSAVVTWGQPDTGTLGRSGRSAVTSYRVYRDGQLVHTTEFSVYEARTFRDEGLTPGQTYHYQVAAVTNLGEGPRASATLSVPSYGFTRFAVGGQRVTVDAGGDVWSTDVSPDAVVQIAADRTSTRYHQDPAGTVSDPTGIVPGPDGNLWFTSSANDRIGRLTPEGQVLTTGPAEVDDPGDITTGPDGNLWFTSRGNDRIGRITPFGVVTTFPAGGVDEPFDIVEGPDGNLWFTGRGNDRVARITPAGAVTSFELPGAGAPYAIALGADGNLWLTDTQRDALIEVTPEGDATIVTDLGGAVDDLRGIAATPGGELWFAARGSGALGRYVIADGSSVLLSGIAAPEDVAVDPAGDVWVTRSGFEVWRLSQSLPPGPPDWSTASGPRDGGVQLRWDPPVDPGTDQPVQWFDYGYRLYRDGALVDEGELNGEAIDVGLVNGQTYSYEVAAVTAAGEGPRSVPLQLTPTSTSRLAIDLASDPATGADVGFTGCIANTSSCSTFSLDDDADATVPATMTAEGIAAGSYTVTLSSLPAGFALRSIDCTGGGTAVDLGNRRFTVTFAAANQVRCSFDIAARGITVVLDADPATSAAVPFMGCIAGSNACGQFALTDDGTPSSADRVHAVDLAPGSYTVYQLGLPPGLELASISCTGGATVDASQGRATITLTASTVHRTCTWYQRPP